MTAYWIMIVLPALMALSPFRAERSLASLAWWGVGAVIIIIIGLRYEVGADWLSYLRYYNDAASTKLEESIKLYRDPGYYFFNWLFANSGVGIWALNLLCATLSVFGIMALSRRQPLPWVALVVAVPYLLLVISMGTVRQSAALGLVCLAMMSAEDKKPGYFLIAIVAATLFHKSATVLLPFYLFALPKIRGRHWLILVVMVFVMVWAFIAETIEAKLQLYEQIESAGALAHLSLSALPAFILLLWKRKLGLNEERYRLWIWVAWISISCIFALYIVDFSSTAIDRLALYLMPLQLVVYSRMHRLAGTLVLRSTLVSLIVAINFVIMFVWLNYSNQAHAWLPYQFFPLVN